ncbi:MAG: polyprenyl synthetase family protein [Acetobacter fabarum]|uniref:polyprenyl synthetase family protein n=1 Tax=Acetobacter fabarum TaxID=483199 RepID=UPI00242D23B5|nr:polyprenyl synthetase family protein [Acetobacter fabarum]MCH4026826.1 polyprenyl synthetase family protein [Acetobacter fabarum]MCH4055041.1 polyprenyl synthetase family protein [Acetobacter fabarum]MCH4085313.1 polyprenyl synthetase family protein [Acetobacter fabarum]MCH4127143.1 polyprenyl synthetase family protein [Acetobacter fabarum]MCH4137444.1 polyprenyl synthetase family protein [Acetobacter fabarum]
MGVAVSLSEMDSAASQDGSGVSVSKPGEAGLKALADYLAADMQACNQVIVDRMQSSVALIPQLAAHLVAAGGKRLRPLLTLASARLCGYNNQDGRMRHVEIAACVEFIHTATLLHDDVVDDSQLRRGLASANAIFGNKASVLVGDFLFARSFQILTADASLDVMAILSAASATLAEGEVMQMTTQNDLSTSVEQYLQVIYGKTAALFAAACESGAVIGDVTPADREALRVYGANLGMAFQLVDDALDYSADQAVLGKEVGDDFKEGKVTLPVLAAYEAGSEQDRVFWRRVIEECEQQPEDLDAALVLIAQTNAIGVTLAKAEEYAALARQALQGFPDNDLKALLLETASYSASRAS